MSSVAIYMEGGGDSRDGKAALRQGMDVFLGSLKDAARARSWRWKLVCCGGREATFKAFRHASDMAGAALVVLLVDAEQAVATTPARHLHENDGWDVSGIPEHAVHLMTQTMETWIVADPDALSSYYGPGFNPNPLPRADNLDGIAKPDVAAALQRATHATRKGGYQKIRHASDLLQRITPEVVKRRCPACKRLFESVGTRIV